MAEKLIHSPNHNPIQFIRQNPSELIDVWGYKPYDQWWAEERNTSREQKVRYTQKVQQSDRVDLLFHTNNNQQSGAELKVYDLYWNEVAFIATNTTQITGQTITSQVTGSVFTTECASHRCVQVAWSGLALSDGYYFFGMKVPFLDPDDPNADGSGVVYEYMISEPLELRTQHRGTVLIQVQNTRNRDDMFFRYFNMRCHLRVEGGLHSLKPDSQYSSYQDERRDIVSLDDKVGFTEIFSTRGIPEWMVVKLNYALACDRVKFGDIYYNKDKEANFEYNGKPSAAYKALSIILRRSTQYASVESTTSSPILVWQVYNNGDNGNLSRFPYFVHSAQLNRGFGPPVVMMYQLNGVNNIIQYSKDCLEVKSAAEEAILLAHANNVTKPQYAQAGFYQFVVNGSGDAGLYYVPTSAETNYTSQSYVVLTKRFRVSYLNTWVNGQRMDVTGSYIGYAFTYSNGDPFNGKYGTGNPNNTYMVGGSSNNLLGEQSYVYHYRQDTATHTIKEIIANYDTFTPNIKQIDGELPATLEVFLIKTGTTSGACVSIDFSIFVPCQNSLIYITLDRNRIVNNMNLNTFAGAGLPVLYAIILTNNRLPDVGAIGVDTFFNNAWNAGSPIYALAAGILATKFQTPAAPPTPASLVARGGIIGDGWTVITD